MPQYPSQDQIANDKLLRFKAIFAKYVGAEKDRLKADLAMLENLNLDSDLGNMVADVDATVLKAAEKELNALLGI